MAGVDLTNYSGLFFKKYAKKVIDTFPPPAIIQSKIPVGEAERVGTDYNVPISVSWPGGTTYSVSRGMYALETAIEGELKTLVIAPASHVFQGVISYPAAAASLASDVAADDTTGRVALDVRNSGRRDIEMDFLYGRFVKGLGEIESANDSTDSIVITEKTFSGAMWQKRRGHKVDIITADHQTSHLAAGVVKSVKVSTRTVYFESGTTLSSVIAGDVIFIKGQVTAASTPVYNTSIGLMTQMANESANLIGLDPATYDTVMGNNVSCSNLPFSFDKLNEGVALTQDRGNESNSMVCLVSSKCWGRLNADIGANRRLDGSYKRNKYEEGVQSITYWTAIGEVEIFSHPLMMRGYALLFSWSDLKRPGTTDMSFTRPVGKGSNRLDFGGMMLTEVAGFAGFSFRCFHESALLNLNPGYGVVFADIDS